MAENYIDKIEVDGVERPIRDTSGSVRYDAPQTLSDEQKAQARGNINSAPGGFGWGDSLRNVLASDTEDTYETYCGKLDALLADMPDGTSQLIYTRGPASTGQYSGAGNIVAVLSKLLGTSASLIGISPEPRDTTNGLWRMLKNNGKWQPVEWINPPMNLGTEYRTTERYLGKPVYVKALNVSSLPNNSNISVNIAANSDGSADETIRAITAYGVTSNGNSIPAWAWSRDPTKKIYLQLYLWIVYLGTTFDASGERATIVVKYTKTTD